MNVCDSHNIIARSIYMHVCQADYPTCLLCHSLNYDSLLTNRLFLTVVQIIGMQLASNITRSSEYALQLQLYMVSYIAPVGNVVPTSNSNKTETQVTAFTISSQFC